MLILIGILVAIVSVILALISLAILRFRYHPVVTIDRRTPHVAKIVLIGMLFATTGEVIGFFLVVIGMLMSI